MDIATTICMSVISQAAHCGFAYRYAVCGDVIHFCVFIYIAMYAHLRLNILKCLWHHTIE